MAYPRRLSAPLILISRRTPCHGRPRFNTRSTVLQTPFPAGARLFRTTGVARVKIVSVPAMPKLPKTIVPRNGPITPPVPTRRISPYEQHLAAKDTPTLLYEAPSHFWFTFSCLSAGTYCTAYGVVNYWTIYMNPPEGLHWVTVPAYGIIICFMVACGAWFVKNASGIIRSIRAIPTSSPGQTTRCKKKPAAGTKSANKSASLQIEISVRRLIPFMGPKTILAPPEDVQIPFCMQAMLVKLQGLQPAKRQPMTELEKRRMQAREKEEREAYRKYHVQHILTAPFRDGARAFRTICKEFARAFFTDGFAKIQVKKRSYRIDLSRGWALENGKALDRLYMTQS